MSLIFKGAKEFLHPRLTTVSGSEAPTKRRRR